MGKKYKERREAGGVSLGITFEDEEYGGYSTAHIYSIVASDGAKEVFLGVASGKSGKGLPVWEVYVNLMDCSGQFPDVERLVIGENVMGICINNRMFPNIKHVESHSPYFLSGPCLVKKHVDGQLAFLNSFCKAPGEPISLEGISDLADGAFDGCRSGNVSGADGKKFPSFIPFYGYAPECSGKALAIGNFLIKADVSSEVSCIPKGACDALNGAFDGMKAHTVLFQDEAGIRMMGKVNGMNCRIAVFDFKDGEAWANGLMSATKYMNQRSWVKEYAVAETDKRYKAIDGIIYSKDGRVLIKCPNGKSGHVGIPEGTEFIAQHAFTDCGVTSVSFPESLAAIDDSAFSGTYIKEVRIPKGVKHIGLCNFLNAETVTVEGGTPTNGLLNACVRKTRFREKEGRPDDHVVKILINGKTLMLPSPINEPDIKPYTIDWDNGFIDGWLLGDTSESAMNPHLRQDASLEIFLAGKGSESTAKYLKSAAPKMAERYIDAKDFRKLSKLMESGVLSDAKAQAFMESMDDPQVRAYLLKKPNKGKKTAPKI